MNTKLLASLLVAATVVAIPLTASAQVWGPPIVVSPHAAGGSPLVVGALNGPRLDPMAATARIVPPRGGTVMLYRDGKMKGWFTQASYAKLEPGRVYGVVATRGSSMLFNAGIIARPGLTEVVWEGSNKAPSIAFTPALRPHYNGHTHHVSASGQGQSHHVGHAAAQSKTHFVSNRPKTTTSRPRVSVAKKSSATTIDQQRYRGMIATMSAQPFESARLNVLRSYSRRYRFTPAQAKTAMQQFRSRSFKLSASRLLRGRTVPATSPRRGRGLLAAAVATRR